MCIILLMSSFKPEHTNEILENTPGALNWVWEPFIPGGALVLLAAFMKVGKTTWAYSLVRAVARGEPFLGFPTRRCGVLVLAVEEHRRDIRNRIERYGLGAGVYFHVGPLNRGAEEWAEINVFCRMRDIGLVVVDTFSRFALLEDENDNAEVNRETTPLLNLCRDTGASVLLIHHTGKGEGQGGRAIRGASSLFASVDQALILALNGQASNGQRKMFTLGRYPETPEEMTMYLVDRETGEYERLSLGHSSDEDLLIDLKGEMPSGEDWVGYEDLAKLVGVPVQKIYKLLKKTVPDWLERQGAGVKGDPYRFRRATCDSTQGEQTRSSPTAGTKEKPRPGSLEAALAGPGGTE